MKARGPAAAYRRILWLALSIGWAAFLLAAISVPAVRALEVAGGGSATGWDKVLHAAAFFVLGILFRVTAARMGGFASPALHTVAASAVGTAYAFVHEGMQLWLPGFFVNPVDLLADLIGMSAGIWIGYRATQRRVRIAPTEG